MRALWALALCGGCGSSSDTKIDAKIDDAPPDVAGPATQLGKPCEVAMGGADCPMEARGCLSPQNGTMGFCTIMCVGSGTFMTNAQSQAMNVMPADTSTQDAQCAAIYAGPGIGTPSCTLGAGGVMFNRLPPGPLQPNMSYTFQIACGIGCGPNGACPMGMSCDTAAGANYCKVP